MNNRFSPSTNDLWVYYRAKANLTEKNSLFLLKKSALRGKGDSGHSETLSY